MSTTQVITSRQTARAKTHRPAQKKFDVYCDACGHGVEEPATDTMQYCPECRENYEYCNACHSSSNPTTKHSHPLITLRTIVRQAPADFWKDVVAGTDSDRFCDACDESIASRIDQHVQCASCHDCDFCINCVADGKAAFRSHRCRRASKPQLEWDFYGVEGVDEKYLEKQMALAEAEKACLRRARPKPQRIDTRAEESVESPETSPSSSIYYPGFALSQVRHRRVSPG